MPGEDVDRAGTVIFVEGADDERITAQGNGVAELIACAAIAGNQFGCLRPGRGYRIPFKEVDCASIVVTVARSHGEGSAAHSVGGTETIVQHTVIGQVLRHFGN